MFHFGRLPSHFLLVMYLEYSPAMEFITNGALCESFPGKTITMTCYYFLLQDLEAWYQLLQSHRCLPKTFQDTGKTCKQPKARGCVIS